MHGRQPRHWSQGEHRARRHRSGPPTDDDVAERVAGDRVDHAPEDDRRVEHRCGRQPQPPQREQDQPQAHQMVRERQRGRRWGERRSVVERVLSHQRALHPMDHPRLEAVVEPRRHRCRPLPEHVPQVPDGRRDRNGDQPRERRQMATPCSRPVGDRRTGTGQASQPRSGSTRDRRRSGSVMPGVKHTDPEKTDADQPS